MSVAVNQSQVIRLLEIKKKHYLVLHFLVSVVATMTIDFTMLAVRSQPRIMLIWYSVAK